MLAFIWLLLLFSRPRCSCRDEDPRNSHVSVFLRAQHTALGPIAFKEAAVLAYFLLLVLVWFFAEPSFISGWSGWFLLPGGGEAVSEATPAILVLVLLLVTPEHLRFWPFIDEVDSKSFRYLQIHELTFKEIALRTPFPAPIMTWKTLSKVRQCFLHTEISIHMTTVHPMGTSHSAGCWLRPGQGF